MEGGDQGFFCVFYRMTLTEEPCYQAPLHDSGPEKPHKWDINDSTLPMVSKKSLAMSSVIFPYLPNHNFYVVLKKPYLKFNIKIMCAYFYCTELLISLKNNSWFDVKTNKIILLCQRFSTVLLIACIDVVYFRKYNFGQYSPSVVM